MVHRGGVLPGQLRQAGTTFPSVPLSMWLRAGLGHERSEHEVQKVAVKQQPLHSEGRCRAPRTAAARGPQLFCGSPVAGGSGLQPLGQCPTSSFRFSKSSAKCKRRCTAQDASSFRGSPCMELGHCGRQTWAPAGLAGPSLSLP